MALPIRVARAVVGILNETTSGSANPPLVANSFHAKNITIKPSQATYERNVTRAHFGNLDDIPGASEMEISFEMDMVPGESAGAASLAAVPIWDVPMIACGHKRTWTTGSSTVYVPTTTFVTGANSHTPVSTTPHSPSENYTVYVWDETVRYGLSGGFGNVSIETAQGQPGILKFTFKGAYIATADATAVAPTDPLVNPPPFLNATVAVQNYASFVFDGFTFDKGNVLSKRSNSASANGLLSYWLTAHNPMAKISPEMLLVATKNTMGLWRSGDTSSTPNFSVAWGATVNKMSLVGVRTQIKEFSLGEREGARIQELGIKFTTAGTAVDGADYTIQVG